MKRSKGTSILTKTILLNIVLLIAVIVFMLVNHAYVSKMIGENQEDANELYLSVISRQMDEYITNINNYADNILTDSEFLRLKNASTGTIDYIEFLHYVSKSFYNAKYTLSLNPDMYLYLRNSDKIVSQNGADDISIFLNENDLADIDTFLNSVDVGAVSKRNGKLYFTVAKDNNMLLFYEIATDTIGDYLSGMSSMMGDNVYSDIVLADGTSVFYDADGELLTDSGAGYSKQSTIGIMYELTYNVYYSADDRIRQNNVFNIYTLLIALAFIVLNSITIYIYYKMHIPIRKLVKDYKGDNATGSNEYNVISEILDDLSDRNRRFEDKIQSNASSLYSLCLFKLFHGSHDYDIEVYEQLRGRIKNYFVVTAFFEKDAKERNYDHSTELDTLFKQALPAGLEIYSVIETKGQYSYVFCNTSYSPELLEKISALFYKKYGNSAFLSLGISKPNDKLSSIREAYMQSCIALQNQKINVSYSFFYNVFTDSTEMNNNVNTLITYDMEQSVVSQLLAGNEKYINDFLYQVEQQMHIDNTYIEIKQLFIGLNNLLKVACQKANIAYESGVEKDGVDISAICNPKLMYKIIKLRFDDFVMSRNDLQSDLYEKIVDYIRKNIKGELYREKIAGEFGITPEYLSTYFKKISGENMVDFVHREKVNKAKEILRENRYLKIYEVSEMVGIANVKTFIRIFKQYTGVTPKQYQSEKKE